MMSKHIIDLNGCHLCYFPWCVIHSLVWCNRCSDFLNWILSWSQGYTIFRNNVISAHPKMVVLRHMSDTDVKEVGVAPVISLGIVVSWFCISPGNNVWIFCHKLAGPFRWLWRCSLVTRVFSSFHLPELPSIHCIVLQILKNVVLVPEIYLDVP